MSQSPSSAAVQRLRSPHWVEASDGELVSGACAGNRLAQAELYRRHVDRVLGTSARLLGRSAEAEDVTQDAFLVAFRDLKQLREPERFGAWLLGIAVHLVHRRFRRRRLLDRLGLGRGQADCSLEMLAQEAGQETMAILRQIDGVVRALPPDVRLAWLLRYVEGHELKQVAGLCGCSLATAKRRIATGQARLGVLVQSEGSPTAHPRPESIARSVEVKR